MCRAYGSQLGFIYDNGLKPVVTKYNEPTALCYFGQYQIYQYAARGRILNLMTLPERVTLELYKTAKQMILIKQ